MNRAFDHIATITDDDLRWEQLLAFVDADPPGARQAALSAVVADEPRWRQVAAEVLGQVASIDRRQATVIADVLRPRIALEQDSDVLAAVIYALGHTLDGNARNALIERAHHVDAKIRFAIARTLPALGLDGAALGALRELSADSDSDVRDWATHALAVSDAADDATLDALAARVDDPDDDTREEAIAGLARRRDPRARSLVERELARQGHTIEMEWAKDWLD